MTAVTVAGVGPGDPNLVTFSAVQAALASDIITVPRSSPGTPGMAELVISHHVRGRRFIPLHFPMTDDPQLRDSSIRSQVKALRNELEGRRVFFPVIGDCMLYSTGAYFVDAVRHVFGDDVTARFIPGVSAHSLAASLSGTFLAMSGEILTVIPCTASPGRISAALSSADNAALYKPSAVRDMNSLIDPRDFREIIRADHAGIAGREKLIRGDEALNGTEYMSVMLLRR